MWLEKFFQIIDNSFIGKFVDKRVSLLVSTNPDRIYVENVRSFYNLTTPVAKMLCEMAVRENLFTKKIGIECPNCGKIVTQFENEKDIPLSINCDTCELLEREKHIFNNSEIIKTTFYQLNNNVL